MSISFAGGGTDLPSYYSKYGGIAITATIDKYSYVVASRVDGRPTQITRSSDFEINLGGPESQEIDSRLQRLIVERFGLTCGLSVFISSQVPDNAGLGSLTSESVALVKAISALWGDGLSPRSLADEVSRLEVDELKLPIGRQDQYSVSFGGLNCLRFGPDSIEVEPVELPLGALRELENRLMLFYTGRASNSTQLLAERQRGSDRNRASVIEALHASRQIALGLLGDLNHGDIGRFGEWLDRAWQSKKRVIPGITDAWIDQWYESARKAGAAGGKIVGPGGGGFLLLYCEPESHARVIETLQQAGLSQVEFRFDLEGVAILLNQQDAAANLLGTATQHAFGPVNS